MKVAFYTLGCKVNSYETNGMAQKFKESEYEVVNFSEKADVYIVNTCTVTSIADKKSRQFLRQAKHNNPDGIVVAVGCYVQASPEEVKKIPEIDLCLGTNEKNNIVQIVENYITAKKERDGLESQVVSDDVFQNPEYSEFGSVTYTENTRAVIKVQDGCDRFCSYCLIPYARGRVRSRKPENVVQEVKELALKGFKEVVITGIHVASYGKDFKNGYGLIDLLEEINKTDGIERVRLGSIEPLLISEEFIQRFSKLEKMCHQFHLSLQSGCDATLQRMNRRYTTSEFREIVHRIREYFEDSILTTDVIVGFPGETDEEFQNTYEFLKEMKFYKMHVFKYSIRRGTKAENMPNQVASEIKEKRSKLLLELSDRNEKDYLDSYIGKTVKVLFEEKVDKEDTYEGFTSNYLKVNVKEKNDIQNKMLTVKITGRNELKLEGNIE